MSVVGSTDRETEGLSGGLFECEDICRLNGVNCVLDVLLIVAGVEFFLLLCLWSRYSDDIRCNFGRLDLN